MPRPCLFASDLHGRVDRYLKLFAAIEAQRPAAVFLGGDLLPPGFGFASPASSDVPAADSRTPDGATTPAATAGQPGDDFIAAFLSPAFERLRETLMDQYPAVFLILGNDDPRCDEEGVLEGAGRGLWHYAHQRRIGWEGWSVYGYACVPPTPFRLKDWERYDVSRFVDPGCSSPEEGWRTVPVAEHEVRYGTIQSDLDMLAGSDEMDRAIFLFHAPPYKTPLDRAALDGRTIDYVPLDVHVGSIAIQRFILSREPRLTLHGHVHESARLTGEWRTRLGTTHAFSAAHDGPELALVRFDPERLEEATRELL